MAARMRWVEPESDAPWYLNICFIQIKRFTAVKVSVDTAVSEDVICCCPCAPQ